MYFFYIKIFSRKIIVHRTCEVEDRAYGVLFIPHNTVLNDCKIKGVIRAKQTYELCSSWGKARLKGFSIIPLNTNYIQSSFFSAAMHDNVLMQGSNTFSNQIKDF